MHFHSNLCRQVGPKTGLLNIRLMYVCVLILLKLWLWPPLGFARWLREERLAKHRVQLSAAAQVLQGGGLSITSCCTHFSWFFLSCPEGTEHLLAQAMAQRQDKIKMCHVFYGFERYWRYLPFEMQDLQVLMSDALDVFISAGLQASLYEVWMVLTTRLGWE